MLLASRQGFSIKLITNQWLVPLVIHFMAEVFIA